MTKKDYVKAAKIVREVVTIANEHPLGYERMTGNLKAEAMMDAFIALFRDDNPNFDETKFREACKGK